MIYLKILGIIFLAVIAGVGFRYGGSAKHMRWARMAGVQVTELAGMALLFGWSWYMILISGLAWTECTYFKTVPRAYWYNWLLCGIQYALIPIPLAFMHIITWHGFWIRFCILVPVITTWRCIFSPANNASGPAGDKDPDWSEGGCGAWQILTLPLMLIP